MPNFASTAIYRFDINLRDATVLGLVGAGGIGAPLIFAMNSYRWEEAGAILAGLIVLVLIVEWISTKIRVKLAGVSMEKTVQIYYTSDTHGHIFPVNYAANCSEKSGLLNLADQMEKDGNTLVLDGGDSLQGTL